MRHIPVFCTAGKEVADGLSTVAVTSTSVSSPDTNPANLQEPTELTCLRFDSKIVRNDKESQNSVEEIFVYERKGKNDDNFPSERGEVSFRRALSRLATR